jgi:tRNA uridine 5-carbamoylmethylation protein Kti12
VKLFSMSQNAHCDTEVEKYIKSCDHLNYPQSWREKLDCERTMQITDHGSAVLI